MFEPRNLAISCKDCNGAKKEKEVRVDPARVSFPDRSAHYRIPHPHFDTYADHVRWYDKVVHPLTEKGVALVEICKLHRFGLIKAGETAPPQNSVFEDMAGKILDPHATRLELQMAVGAIEAYAKTVPQADGA
jgi:hypothetical protein